MGETPQPHLNGAFYGPSIPPPQQKSYHRPGRRSGGGGFFSCCCGCLCSCIFNLIFQIVFTILIFVGIVLFLVWLIFRPNPVKFHVTDANLTRFDLSSTNNTLYYNLALNITVRNPNKRIGIYYDQIEASAYYQGQRFASTNLTRFYQGHKQTDYMNPVFKGQNVVVLDQKDQDKFGSEKSSGTYSIDLKLQLKVRLKVLFVKSPKFKPKMECDLKIPLDTHGKSSGNFETKKCNFNWRH